MAEKFSKFVEAVLMVSVIGGVAGLYRQLTSIEEDPVTPSPAITAKAVNDYLKNNKYKNLLESYKLLIDKRQVENKSVAAGRILSKLQKDDDANYFDEVKRTSHKMQEFWLSMPDEQEKLKRMYYKDVSTVVYKNTDNTYTLQDVKETSAFGTKQCNLVDTVKDSKIIFLEDFADINKFYRPILSSSQSANTKHPSPLLIYLDVTSGEAGELMKYKEDEQNRFIHAPEHIYPILSKKQYYTYYNISFMETLGKQYHCHPKVLIKFSGTTRNIKNKSPYYRGMVPAEVRVIIANNEISDDELRKIIIAHFGNECREVIIDRIC